MTSVAPPSRIADVALKVRSKNAGPFWITIDVFCGDDRAYSRLAGALSAEHVAGLLRQRPEDVRRFELPELSVLKFSFPRPVVQGHRLDRDMHGAQWAVLLAESALPPAA